MKTTVRLILGLALIFTLASGSLAQEKGQAFLWDGTHWAQVTTEAKAAYIFGIGNLADFERGANPPGRLGCICRAFVNELKSKTVMELVQVVDRFYQENPDKMNRSVIEVVLRRSTSLCPPENAPGGKKQ